MKKTTVTCDYCGEEVVRWIEVYMTPSAKESYMNIADLMPYNTTFQVCKECAGLLMRNLKEVGNDD